MPTGATSYVAAPVTKEMVTYCGQPIKVCPNQMSGHPSLVDGEIVMSSTDCILLRRHCNGAYASSEMKLKGAELAGKVDSLIYGDVGKVNMETAHISEMLVEIDRCMADLTTEFRVKRHIVKPIFSLDGEPFGEEGFNEGEMLTPAYLDMNGSGQIGFYFHSWTDKEAGTKMLVAFSAQEIERYLPKFAEVVNEITLAAPSETYASEACADIQNKLHNKPALIQSIRDTIRLGKTITQHVNTEEAAKEVANFYEKNDDFGMF